MARLFVIIGSLIVLALTAALVAPYFIDWTSYRGEFEREASRILGRPVTVAGSATARLLPFPSVTFRDVRVSGRANAAAMTIDEFSMDAELAPMMSGEIRVFDMRLVRPKATIAVAADGSIDWMARSGEPFDGSSVHLEHVSIVDGSVTLEHGASGRTHTLSGIEATVSARTLAGPWRLDGALRFDGSPVILAASTGVVDETGALRVRIQADPKQYPVVFDADGDLKIERGAPVYAGKFNLSARTVAAGDLRGGAPKPDAKAPVSAYRVSGDFKLGDKLLGIDAFRLETGSEEDPYTADGTAFVQLGVKPRFSVTATGAQVRVDDAIPAEDKVGGLTLHDRLEAFKDAVTALPMPSMEGTVELDLPAVLAGDTTIRDVKLQAEPAGDSWRLKTMSATLPGRTTIEASGLLATDHDRFGFTGKLLLAVAQPSGFAAWLSRDVDDAIRKLPAAGFSANVALTETKQTFDALELDLGGARFHGRFEAENPADRKPSLAVALDGGALDIEGLAAFASLFVSDAGVNRFGDSDLDLALKAGPVTARGMTAERIDTALRLKSDRLDIDRLAISGLEGAEIGATGGFDGFPADPTGNLDASVISVDLAPLAAKLAAAFPANFIAGALGRRSAEFPGLLADSNIDIVASAAAGEGGKKEAALVAKGLAGGTTLSLTASSPDFAALVDAPLLIQFAGSNDSASPLFALAGLPAFELGLTGAAEFKASLDGALPSGAAASLSLIGKDGAARFDGSVARSAGGIGAAGVVSVRSADISPWLATNGITLPGQGLGLPVSLTADGKFDGGTLTLAGLKGDIAGSAVAGDLAANLKNGRPHLAGSLRIDHLDLALPAEMLLGEPALLDEGAGWPQAAIAPKGNDAFSADLAIDAKNLILAGALPLTGAHASLHLDAESFRLSDFSALYAKGKLSGLAEIRNNGGTALLSMQTELRGADLGAALDGGALGGTGDFAASLTASGKSLSALAASLSGSGTARLAPGATIGGINPNAFDRLLAQADQAGREIDQSKVQAFAPGVAGDGGFISAGAEIPFTIAAGVLRTAPFRLENARATVTGDLRADLSSGDLAANGEIAYDPGNERLVGSEPVLRFSTTGPIGATALAFDAEPLAQFLTQRALEREQARVEAMQASLLEKQRLRREVRYYQARADDRQRAEEERLRAEEAARLKAEEEARLKAEAGAKAAADLAAQAAAERAAADAALEAAVEEQRKAAEKAAAEERRKAAEKARVSAPKLDIKPPPLPLPQAGNGGFDAPTVDKFLGNSVN